MSFDYFHVHWIYLTKWFWTQKTWLDLYARQLTNDCHCDCVFNLNLIRVCVWVCAHFQTENTSFVFFGWKAVSRTVTMLLCHAHAVKVTSPKRITIVKMVIQREESHTFLSIVSKALRIVLFCFAVLCREHMLQHVEHSYSLMAWNNNMKPFEMNSRLRLMIHICKL